MPRELALVEEEVLGVRRAMGRGRGAFGTAVVAALSAAVSSPQKN